MTNPSNDASMIDQELERMLGDISKRRIESAASGAALLEKARRLAKRLEDNDLAKRAALLEKQTNEELNAATAKAIKSLHE